MMLVTVPSQERPPEQAPRNLQADTWEDDCWVHIKQDNYREGHEDYGKKRKEAGRSPSHLLSNSNSAGRQPLK